MRHIKRIIIHCSDTPEGRDDTADDIDRWHRAKGYNGIGYHYVVRLDGTIETGRPLKRPGAHCKGYNKSSIGICYIGGRSSDMKRYIDTRTAKQRAALRTLLTDLRRRFPQAAILGHRDLARKACPSFDAKAEYKDI